MSRKRYTPEQIISMLREAEVALAQGQSVGQACRTLGVSEQSYYRWRKEYGGLRTDQAKRLKDLEKENGRLRKAISDRRGEERLSEPRSSSSGVAHRDVTQARRMRQTCVQGTGCDTQSADRTMAASL